MKISYSFSSLKDLSDLSNGEKLLEILLSYGLIVNKAGGHEPIRKDFVMSNLSEMWKGVGINGGFKSCCFLFKGKKEATFSGMVTWDVNLFPNTKAFNGISLWMNIPKNYNFCKLMQLGDDIFTWSEAVYGYITEDTPTKVMKKNLHDGLSGLMWVNYFGSPYVMEPDFYIPSNHVRINNGAKLILSETPNDEILNDPVFLESIKREIGVEWFWHSPRKYMKKVPCFDKSSITRKC